MARVLVTGVAGFIGLHVAERLLERGDTVIGVDSLNDYYDPGLKAARLGRLSGREGFSFHRLDLVDRATTEGLFASGRFERVIHLAAQPGVRYSLVNPHAYTANNIAAFLHVLEGCRYHGVTHLVYASTSSVYGANAKLPFSVQDPVDHPVSLYAATKKANELMAHTYSHLFGLPTTGLRFFTVYGPWGRPDMAPSLFTRAILEGRTLDVFNEGRMQRDFTFVDDVAEGVVRVSEEVATPSTEWDPTAPDPSISAAPFRVYNIGNNRPVELLRFIQIIEECTGRKANLRMLPMQPGDVEATCADIDTLSATVGFKPSTPLEVGMERFVRWYREYHQI